MSYGDSHQSARDQAPLVGRPRGAAWRTLQADGVVWEGQVVLVGGETDLATRMIVTHRRVVFARGGMIALDLARDWLRPAPILRRDGTILLSITAPGSGYGTEPETISLRMRDGHPAAGHVIAMLAGSGARRIVADSVPSSDYVRGVLPPFPDVRHPRPVPQTEADPNVTDFPLLPSRLEDDLSFGSLEFKRTPPSLPPLPAAAMERAAEREPVVRPAAPPTSMHRDRTWNLEPMRDVVPRGVRRRRGWVLRLGGLVVLIGVASMLATDRIPLRTSPLATEDPPTATVRPIAQYAGPTAASGLPLTVVAESTAVALGVGGETAQAGAIPTPAGATTQQPTAAPAPTEPPAVDNSTTGDAGSKQPAAAETTAPEQQAAAGSNAPETQPAAETTAPEVATEPQAPEPEAVVTEAPPVEAAASPLRQSVDSAKRGPTLPEYGLAAADSGEWVTILVTVVNDSAAEASLSLADFRLSSATDGAEFAIDKRSTVVASILRLDGAPDALDSAITLDPGEAVELALVFQVPATATELNLIGGDTSITLAPEVAGVTRPLTMTRGYTRIIFGTLNPAPIDTAPSGRGVVLPN